MADCGPARREGRDGPDHDDLLHRRCTALSAGASRLSALPLRLAVGAAVGLLAAAAPPGRRTALEL